MSDPTDADRAKAAKLPRSLGCIYDPQLEAAIAVALAEQRDQARAPFLALANWLDTTDDPFRDDPSYIADIIRYALAGTAT